MFPLCFVVSILRLVILSQCSRDDVSEKLKKPLSSSKAVHIANPKTLEFQVKCASYYAFVFSVLIIVVGGNTRACCQ